MTFGVWLERLKDPLTFHLDRGIPLRDSIFRIGSAAYVNLFNRARSAAEKLDPVDQAILDETEIGGWGDFDGRRVPLDVPLPNPDPSAVHEGDEPELDQPKRGGKKKYYVYTRDPETGKVVRVEFGYPGMDVGTSDLERSKNFSRRHDCPSKRDKLTPGYWSCALPRYAKQLGLSEPAYKYW